MIFQFLFLKDLNGSPIDSVLSFAHAAGAGRLYRGSVKFLAKQTVTFPAKQTVEFPARSRKMVGF